MSAAPNPRVLVLALDPQSKKCFEDLSLQVEIISADLNLEKLIEQPLEPHPHVIVCGADNSQSGQINEVAQTLKSIYPNAATFLFTTKRDNLDRKDLKKNGFTDVFFLPNENKLMKEAIEKEISNASRGKIKFFKSVSMLDLAPDETLDFDVFIHMPVNKKYIKIVAANLPLDVNKSKKLKSHQINSVHITTDQISNFYKFTASQLKKVGSSTTMSETEKKELREQSVRHLLTNMFRNTNGTDTFESGKAMLNDCQEIVKHYVTDGNAQNSWYEKFIANTNSYTSTYNHAANVSTFAALFSIGLGIGKPDELAMAGLLHDIGITALPPDLQIKPESQISAEDLEVYKQHPQLAIDMIKQRKIVISDSVTKMILQHHERFNGSGYPLGSRGDEIKPESQILAISDYFDSETFIQDGRVRKTPQELFRELYDNMMANPTNMIFDPKLIKKILSLFSDKEVNAKKEVA